MHRIYRDISEKFMIQKLIKPRDKIKEFLCHLNAARKEPSRKDRCECHKIHEQLRVHASYLGERHVYYTSSYVSLHIQALRNRYKRNP